MISRIEACWKCKKGFRRAFAGMMGMCAAVIARMPQLRSRDRFRDDLVASHLESAAPSTSTASSRCSSTATGMQQAMDRRDALLAALEPLVEEPFHRGCGEEGGHARSRLPRAASYQASF